MTLAEHAHNVRHTLKAAERALRKHHKALQDMLEEFGPGLLGDVTPFGGGTPKTPDPDE